MLSPRAIAIEGAGFGPLVLAVRGFASIAVASSMLGKIVATAIELVTMSASAQLVSMTPGQTGKA